MFKYSKEKKFKGGLSQILVATFLTPIIIFLFMNLIISVLHMYTRNNINQIAQEMVTDIASVGTITEELNNDYKSEINKYNTVLKGYDIKYTFSQYSKDNKSFVDVITLTNNINNDPLKSLKPDIPTKVTVRINQTNISTLQKFNNILTGQKETTRISVKKSIIISTPKSI